MFFRFFWRLAASFCVFCFALFGGFVLVVGAFLFCLAPYFSFCVPVLFWVLLAGGGFLCLFFFVVLIFAECVYFSVFGLMFFFSAFFWG